MCVCVCVCVCVPWFRESLNFSVFLLVAGEWMQNEEALRLE